MRVSTNEFLLGSLSDMLAQQANINQLNREIATGQTILDASNDPSGAGSVIGITNANAQLNYDSSNAQAATQTLQSSVSALQQVSTLLDNLRQVAVQAASSSTNSGQRQSFAAIAQSDLQQLVGLANTRDTNGRYVFAGSQAAISPFQLLANGQVTFNGDAGQNQIGISPSLSIPTGLSGQNIFMNVAASAGGVGANASGSNAGSGFATVVSANSGQVTSERIAGTQYSVTIEASSDGSLTYLVTSGTGAPGSSSFAASSGTVASGSFTSGSDVTFGGIDIRISGTPVAGDQFTVQPGATTTIFQTVQNLVSALNSSQQGQAGTGQFQQQIQNVLSNLDGAETSVLTAQASFGSWLTEIQSVQGQNSTTIINNQSQISNLQSANLPQVIANYSESVTALQAAQLAFARIQNLTLFSVIKT